MNITFQGSISQMKNLQECFMRPRNILELNMYGAVTARMALTVQDLSAGSSITAVTDGTLEGLQPMASGLEQTMFRPQKQSPEILSFSREPMKFPEPVMLEYMWVVDG